jgi:hypothetical protein
MKEIAFKLEPDEDGWPPAAEEWLWLEEKVRHHVVRNAPFFLPGIAADDEIELCTVDPDGRVGTWRVVAPSGRSVIWIAGLNGAPLDKILLKFRELDCNTSILHEFNHATVDVPPNITLEQVDGILEELDPEIYAIAFPCDRQT